VKKPLTAVFVVAALAPAGALAQAAEVAVPSEAPVPPAPPTLVAPAPVGAIMVHDAPLPVTGRPGMQLELHGYVRTLFSTVFNDNAESDFVGQYDGFQMVDARIKVDARKGDTRVHVALDGAVDRRRDSNSAEGEIDARLTDAFVEQTTLGKYIKLTAGQFEAPFDAEEATSTEDLVFAEAAIESRGVKGVEGYNLQGLSLDRQVGLMLSSDPIYFGDGADREEGFGLAYALSATNGNAAGRPQNDNEKLAYTARLELMYGPWVTVGVGYHMNELTDGTPPDRLTTERSAMAFDLRAQAFGAHLLGQLMMQTDKVKEVSAEPEVKAQGYHVQVWYDAPFGLTPAYRFAHFDPTSDVTAEGPAAADRIDTDDVTVHTVGLGVCLPGDVFKVKFDYNLVQENDARAVDNDRLDVLFQGAF